MKKLILIMLICTAIPAPVLAQAHHEGKHAVGNIYTKVLNIIEASGMLDTLEPKKHVLITDMHIDHGDLYVTMSAENGAKTVVYNMIGGLVVSNASN